ncbi:MAG: BatD family protein [Saprospiraceae bacterium]|nr:BatD family protein [Saprospiraceae bacterium]
MICSLVAQTPRFYIQTDRTTVSEGEAFTLEAVLENIDANNIQLGDLRGFTVMQGPSTSTSVSIINGKRSSTISWQYIIMAPHKGRFKISPATAKVGSKVIKSNELQIEVTVATQKQNDVTLDDSKMSFIRLEVADNDVFIGQQLALDYVLYTRQNIESYDIISQPQTEGFFKQALGDFTDQPQKRSSKEKNTTARSSKETSSFLKKQVCTSWDLPILHWRYHWKMPVHHFFSGIQNVNKPLPTL